MLRKCGKAITFREFIVRMTRIYRANILLAQFCSDFYRAAENVFPGLNSKGQPSGG
jgi:hypothetical protein